MKKFLTVLLTFTLYFNLFTTAHAANVGGWTLGGGVAQGASTVYEGTKRVVIDGVDYIKKGTAKITPPASGVAKVLARGAAGYALSVAVEQLLGSVDWVLDPENNAIKYFPEVSDCQSSGCPHAQKVFTVYGDDRQRYLFDSLTTACAFVATQSNQRDYTLISTNMANAENGNCYFHSKRYPDLRNWDLNYQIPYVSNPAYNPNAEREEKSIPLETVAQQVISNAESGDASAQVATTAAAADIVAEAEKDDAKARPIVQQLEASAQTKPADEAAAEKANEATGEAKPNTANPEATDLSIEFPVFCGWAPLVCEAAQVVISFPQTLTNWWETGKSKAEEWATSISEAWTAVKDWAKSEQQDDTELDIPEQEQPDIDTDIAFGGSCPSDREAEVNMGVGIIKLPISYEPICTTVSTAKPVLIFVGFFIAALIIGGVRSE
ncbi:virulence factor TspB C-terminal domain-related protein [Acinetobacter thermotolerans]|uniref:virulence factor TspB C-terminal domain-related protein n=1 Tax=Acinetobacter thermotolerans TaxID=3151487 RepID=UPI00325B0C66